MSALTVHAFPALLELGKEIVSEQLDPSAAFLLRHFLEVFEHDVLHVFDDGLEWHTAIHAVQLFH